MTGGRIVAKLPSQGRCRPNLAVITPTTDRLMSRDYRYDRASHPFTAGAQGYHPNNALWLAAAANLAYEDPKIIWPVVRSWGFERFRFLHANGRVASAGADVPVDTQAYLCSGRRALLIAFRGTEVAKIKDWFTDLMVTEVPAPIGTGKVHKGFAAALSAVWPQLTHALSELHEGQAPIWITGHSLGGALAVLAAAQLHSVQPVQGLYTFGQPRVGDREFAKSVSRTLAGRVIRFVNNNDVVPQVPPPGLFLKYWHSEREVRFAPDGQLIFDISLWTRTRSLVEGSMQDLGKLGIDAVTDHSMDRYIGLTRNQLLTA